MADIVYSPVNVMKDDSGHWYIIPIGLVGQFQNFMVAIEFDENQELIDNFEAMFSEYRTGGDVNLVQLYVAT